MTGGIPESRFDRLVRRARGEHSPPLDVSGRVLETLLSTRAPAAGRMGLLFVAGSLTAAAVALFAFACVARGASIVAVAQPFVTVLR